MSGLLPDWLLWTVPLGILAGFLLLFVRQSARASVCRNCGAELADLAKPCEVCGQA
jgi:hypothetical protein